MINCRAIVETQRVQIQILGGLRESRVRCRLGGSAENDPVSLPDSGSSASPNANAAVSTITAPVPASNPNRRQPNA